MQKLSVPSMSVFASEPARPALPAAPRKDSKTNDHGNCQKKLWGTGAGRVSLWNVAAMRLVTGALPTYAAGDGRTCEPSRPEMLLAVPCQPSSIAFNIARHDSTSPTPVVRRLLVPIPMQSAAWAAAVDMNKHATAWDGSKAGA